MSSNKQQRAQRRYNNRRVIKEQLAIRQISSDTPVTIQPGKFRKHYANNCGRSKCMMCSNPRKTWKRKTLKEISVIELFRYEVLHREED